jgi:hypothetical protein
MRIPNIPAYLLTLSLLSAPALAAEIELDPRDAAPHAKISLRDAIAKALAKHPGHAVEAYLEAELEDGKLEVAYEVEIVTAAFEIYEVVVDPKTGAILESEKDDDEDAAEEAAEWHAALRHYELNLGQLIAKSEALLRGQPVAAELCDEDVEADVLVAQGRYLFELELEGRAGQLMEIELVRKEREDDGDEGEEEEEEEGESEEHGDHDHGAEHGHEAHGQKHALHPAQLKGPMSAKLFPVATPLAKGVVFQSKVTHPYFPLAQIEQVVLASQDEKVIRDVLPKAHTIAGIPCTVLRETEYEDGKLAEISHNFFAQDAAGNVWYFGETVDEYKDGKVIGHGGAWLVGKNAKEPCLFMPAKLEIGTRFRRENTPPDALEFDMIAARDGILKLGKKKATQLLVILESDRLDRWEEKKFYAKGIGLVSENGELNLVSFERK